MAYNNMHEVQLRDAVAAAPDADVAEARDYWQRRADAHSAYDYSQRYADICRAELKARADAPEGEPSWIITNGIPTINVLDAAQALACWAAWEMGGPL